MHFETQKIGEQILYNITQIDIDGIYDNIHAPINFENYVAHVVFAGIGFLDFDLAAQEASKRMTKKAARTIDRTTDCVPVVKPRKYYVLDTALYHKIRG